MQLKLKQKQKLKLKQKKKLKQRPGDPKLYMRTCVRQSKGRTTSR